MFRKINTILYIYLAIILIFAGTLKNIYQHARLEELRKTDAIVVLGAGQWNGQPSDVLKARLDRARDLYLQGYAPIIILTGGTGKNETISESQVGKNYLISLGLQPSIILIEEVSHTTLENLRQTENILQKRKLNSFLLVSHDFHMMRAKTMAHNLHIIAFSAPVTTKNASNKFQYSFREVIMYYTYLLLRI